jgi:Activator of Hsp90 ATPase homolog 1-like protein
VAFYGRYLEVIPQSRLVWTNEEGGDGGPVATVTFEEEGGKTLVVLRELQLHPEGSPRRWHRLRGGAARDVRATGRASRRPGRERGTVVNVERAADVGGAAFALNLTLDECCGYREMILDDEVLDHFTQLRW